MAAKPLSATSSISEWLGHPVGGGLIRDLLAQGGQTEAALRPVRMLPLQQLVDMSQGQLTQQMIDTLVSTANGGDTEMQGAGEAEPQRPRPASSVVVVIGIGGMGESIARRQGVGHQLVIADFSEPALERVADTLTGEGFDVTTQIVDVASRKSVAALATAAAEAGAVTQVIHTAGLSPAQAPTTAIVAVDLVGVALVLEEFGAVVAPGAAGVVISSMAGHGAVLDADTEHALATTPADLLTELPAVAALADAGAAYTLAKRANHLRVQAASTAWGARGARVNSVSPGVISTPMGQQEINGEYGDVMRAMVAASGTGRIGTPSDIADAVTFLLGPTSTFITGTDLLVDGGVTAAQRAL